MNKFELGSVCKLVIVYFNFSGVLDIDAEDAENPQLCTEYAPLMYAYLRQLELEQPIRKDFLKVKIVQLKLLLFLYIILSELPQRLRSQ